jgi:hypothetical protein
VALAAVLRWPDALLGPSAGRVVVTLLIGLALAAAGLTGALPTEGTTLAALGVTLAVAAAGGAAGRTPGARVGSWLAAVATGLLLALAAAMAAGLDRRPAAYSVLAAAALALVGAILLRGRRPARATAIEATAVEAAAHAGAVVALLLAIESARHAAGVCVLWGVVLGLRALVPGEAAGLRRTFVGAAAGAEVLAWWLLMAGAQVDLVEAYSVPAAVVALFAGWLAIGHRAGSARAGLGRAGSSHAGSSSWVAYGPGLAAGFLPSLAMVFVADGHPLRRLLLGLAGLAVLLAGVAWRRQSPVVFGGGTLALVALHELLLVWDLLPRWIPLAAAGLLLVGLAMTLERRRRDLSRVRDALARMS